MKRCIITGPTGAVGTALIEYARLQNCEVVAVIRRGSSRRSALPLGQGLSVVECNLDELNRLPLYLQENNIRQGFDVFYHLAWDGTFGNTRDNYSGQVKNIQYTLDAVHAAHALDCRRFVGAGSQAEYGRHESPLTADTPCFPENGYGMAKLCAGQMSRDLAETLGMEHVWPRILSVYGPRDRRQTMIMYIIDTLLEGEKPRLSAGEQIWDYLYAEDAGRAMYLLGEKGRHGKVYPVGSGSKRTLADYVRLIRDRIDPSLDLGFGEIPYGSRQVMYLSADISELTADTGFVPEVTFEEGAARTILWCRENPA